MRLHRRRPTIFGSSSIVKHLVTLAGLNPTLAADCLDFFVGCIRIYNWYHYVEVIQGLQQLATVSSMCLLRTISHISLTYPTSSTLEDIRWRYSGKFPPEAYFRGLPFYYTMAAVHSLLKRCWWHRRVEWGDYEPSTEESLPVAQALVKLAQFIEGPKPHQKYLVSFSALQFIPSIPGYGLECEVSYVVVTPMDQRWAHI